MQSESDILARIIADNQKARQRFSARMSGLAVWPDLNFDSLLDAPHDANGSSGNGGGLFSGSLEAEPTDAFTRAEVDAAGPARAEFESGSGI